MKQTDLRAAKTQLTAENRRVLRRMERYFDSYSLNEVAHEELMMDLVGMALECQQRGQPFSEAVGMDEVAFCRELVVNCPRETRTERVLSGCRWMVAWIGIIVPVMFFLKWVFDWMPGSFTDEGLYRIPVSYLCKYGAAVIPIAVAVLLFKRWAFHSQSLLWTAFVTVFLVVFISVSEVTSLMVPKMQVTISLFLWVLVFGALFLVFHITKRLVAMTVAYQQRKRQV